MWESPDEITNDDTGDVDLFGDRQKWRLSPKWEYDYSDISSFGVDLDYFDVRYDEIISTEFSDYTDARLNINYRRKFSNVNTALLTVTGRQFSSGPLLK